MEKKRPTGIETAYTNDGYLEDQARITDVRYGCRTSDRNGCGWIAVYNLLHSLQVNVRYQDIVDALSRHSLFRGLLGTSPFRIRRYLKRCNHSMEAAIGRARAVEASKRARAGILMYRHSGGWHFVAFSRMEQGGLRFYNAVAGRPCICTMEQFLAEQNCARIVWMLYTAVY